jgi:epoxyqueuosine reductase QueG
MDSTLAALIQDIADFVEHDDRNAMAAHGGMKMYDAPLVGVAAADDDWFAQFTEPSIVGPCHISPHGWLPEARSVVCWFLPFTKDVRDTNRAPGLPSEEWATARINGEAFNNALRTFVTDWLKSRGGMALAPVQSSGFSVASRISNWSERHVAFAAGLGTFGLHRALITQKGTAGRLGSVITSMELEPTPRPYTLFDEYCPFLTQKRRGIAADEKHKCGACIRRCPPGAILACGKDHSVCSDYIDTEVLPLFAPRYGCAKCNISVPCESRIPNARLF